MKRRGSYAAVALVLTLAGCTSHYRDALIEYRSGEPVPFFQRTMEWAADTPDAPAPDTDLRPSSEATELLEGVPQTENRASTVAATVLGVPVEWYEARSEQWSDPTALTHALGDELSWRELAVAVAVTNPSVAAAHDRWNATLKQYSQAEFLEGLLREYRMFTRYLDTGAGEATNKEMAKAYFPYPSTISLKGEMIREQARIAELEWERVFRDVLIEAGVLYFNYQFQHRGAETVAENVRLLDNLVNVVQERYATGLATQPDVLRLQTALERQRNLLADFQSRARSDAAQINALLGRPADAALGRPDGADLTNDVASHDALMAVAHTHRQEILIQEARVARTEIAIRMGEVMNRPLASQGASLLERGAMPESAVDAPGGERALGPESVPAIPAYAQAEAYLAEMRHRLAAERQTLDRIGADTGALALTLLEQADIARRQVELVRDVVLPLDQSAYDIALRGYTGGDTSFLDLLDAERKLIETRLELVGSQRDKNQALVRLAEVRGSLLGLN